MISTIHEPVELSVTDEDLMDAIQRQEPEALSELYDRHSAILKAVIVRVVHDDAEADDLLQEIFMQIWNQAAKYSEQKGKALGWIIMLTRRRAIDRLRKRQAYCRATERLENQTDQQPESWTHSRIDDQLFNDDLREFLGKRISSLPALQKEAIELAFYRGMSQREIARHTRSPLGTVKTRIELGLRKLHESVKSIRDEF